MTGRNDEINGWTVLECARDNTALSTVDSGSVALWLQEVNASHCFGKTAMIWSGSRTWRSRGIGVTIVGCESLYYLISLGLGNFSVVGSLFLTNSFSINLVRAAEFFLWDCGVYGSGTLSGAASKQCLIENCRFDVGEPTNDPEYRDLGHNS
jgi:hypothetical protein